MQSISLWACVISHLLHLIWLNRDDTKGLLALVLQLLVLLDQVAASTAAHAEAIAAACVANVKHHAMRLAIVVTYNFLSGRIYCEYLIGAFVASCPASSSS